MKFFNFRKKKGKESSVAIDIGTQYVKIVELVPENQGYKIKNYKILNLVSDGKRFLSREISHLIKKAFSDMAIEANIVKSSISGKSLIVRHVDLPKMTKQELKSSLRTQLGALLAMPAFDAIKRMMDPAEIGAAPLLGVDGLVFIGHGRSDARALVSAIRTARQAVAVDLRDKLHSAIQEQLGAPPPTP